jgi:mannose-6-phosphate isomerase
MTEPAHWYPLSFEPLPEPAPWHGAWLTEYLAGGGRPALPAGTGVCWELVERPGGSSRVAAGALAGRTLAELTAAWPRALVGSRHQPGAPFPLYLRLLDVGRRLPPLVDPDETLCREQPTLRTNTKFWHCLLARPEAELLVGIRGRVTALQMTEHLREGHGHDLLQGYPAQPGDAYLIPAGRLHSVDAGILVWELGRNPGWPLEVTGDLLAREGDAAVPLRAIRFEDRQVARICREMGVTAHTRKIPLVGHCPHFVVEEIRLADHWFDKTDGTSFHLLAVVRGAAALETGVGRERLPVGSVRLIPAQFGGYRAVADGGPAELLRVRLQSLR